MSAIVHQDLIDASELDSLLQRLTTAQNDKERLRHLKTAARNYTFDGGQIARLLAPMAASPAAAVEAAVMLLRRAVPRAADPAAVETAVAALVYDEQRADVKARLGLGPGDITDAAEPLAVSSTAADEALRGFADRSGAIALNCPAVPTADGRGVTMSVPVKPSSIIADDNKVRPRDGRRDVSPRSAWTALLLRACGGRCAEERCRLFPFWPHPTCLARPAPCAAARVSFSRFILLLVPGPSARSRLPPSSA